jgi:hypothetical protein
VEARKWGQKSGGKKIEARKWGQEKSGGKKSEGKVGARKWGQPGGSKKVGELVREDAHQMGLRERTFEKVHGLTWFNSIILKWSTKSAQFNTENWLFWE